MQLNITISDDNGQPMDNGVTITLPDSVLDRVIHSSTGGIYAKSMEEMGELIAATSKLYCTLSDDAEKDGKRYNDFAEEFIDVLICVMLILRQNPEIWQFMDGQRIKKEDRFIRRALEDQVIFRSNYAKQFAMNGVDGNSFKQVMKDFCRDSISEEMEDRISSQIAEFGVLVGLPKDSDYQIYGDTEHLPQYILALFGSLDEDVREHVMTALTSVDRYLSMNPDEIVGRPVVKQPVNTEACKGLSGELRAMAVRRNNRLQYSNDPRKDPRIKSLYQILRKADTKKKRGKDK